MNKIITISVTVALSAFLVGCSGTPDAPDSEISNNSHMSSVESNLLLINSYMTNKEIAKIVKKAGEDAGWRMSEFKSDSFIAEKFDGEDSISTTVKFTKNTIKIDPENDDLKDAINKALNR